MTSDEKIDTLDRRAFAAVQKLHKEIDILRERTVLLQKTIDQLNSSLSFMLTLLLGLALFVLYKIS